MPYTSLNGHMFSFLTTEGMMALRLSKDDRETFVKKYKTEPVVQYGSVMKEYVAIPDSLLTRTALLKPYFESAIEYIASLKPKPTTRKTSKKSAKKAAKKASRPKKAAKPAATKTVKKAAKKKTRKSSKKKRG